MCDCQSYNLDYPNTGTPEVAMKLPFDLGDRRETVCIDACIAETIQMLWDMGVVTLSCCCGHNGRTDRSVVVNPETVDIAKKVLSDLNDPMKVLCWKLVET